MHPGWADTPGVAKSLPSFSGRYWSYNWKFSHSTKLSFVFLIHDSLSMYFRFQGKLRTSEEGADTIIWLALQPKEKLVSGSFYFDRAEAPKHLKFAATADSHARIDSIIDILRSLNNLPSRI